LGLIGTLIGTEKHRHIGLSDKTGTPLEIDLSGTVVVILDYFNFVARLGVDKASLIVKRRIKGVDSLFRGIPVQSRKGLQIVISSLCGPGRPDLSRISWVFTGA
jgi:hypothetical protein